MFSFFFFSSRRRHTRSLCDWSSDVCSSDLRGIDARDNASVLLREPHTIEFGTIFLAGLRSDEAMISVLAHELTHVASGRSEERRVGKEWRGRGSRDS